MRVLKASLLGIVAASSLLALGACDRQAVKERRGGADATADGERGDRASRRAERRAERDGSGDGAVETGPIHSDGKPMWAGNRRNSPDEQAQRQFERNGDDFGAATKQAYVDKVHAFVTSPPAGVLTATRGNGDKLFYDAKTNTFAVVSRKGAPRTMFKPREGRQYWTEQLAKLDEYGQGRGRGRNRDGDGERGYADRGGRRGRNQDQAADAGADEG